MEEQLIELLSEAYGITLADARRLYDEQVAPSISSDEDIQLAVEIYTTMKSGGDLPQGLEDIFHQTDAELNQWVALNVDQPEDPRVVQLRQRFDKVAAKEFGAVTAEEKAILDEVFRDMFRQFTSSGRQDADFEGFFDDNFDRIANDIDFTTQAEQRREEEQQLARRVEARDVAATDARIRQAAEMAADRILKPVEQMNAEEVDQRAKLIRNIETEFKQRLDAGQDLGLFTREGFLNAVDMATEQVRDFQRQQELIGVQTGTVMPPAIPGMQAALETLGIPPGTGGLTEEQMALQRANLDESIPLRGDFNRFINERGIGGEFGQFLASQFDNLTGQFRQNEQKKAATISEIMERGGSGLGAGVPGEFQPMSFADFLASEVNQLGSNFATERRQTARRRRQAAAIRRPQREF